MKTEFRTERILCSTAVRIASLALVCMLATSFATGCKNGCQSCLFKRDKDREIVDSTQLGQDKNQTPAPPAVPDDRSLSAMERPNQDQAIILQSSPMTPTPEQSLASNAQLDSMRIPNTASSPGATASSDPANSRPSLGQIPDANGQARSFQPDAVAPLFQSVAPSDSEQNAGALHFAPSELDHSSALAPEVKNNDELPPAPEMNPRLNVPLPPEFNAQAPEDTGARPTEPPVESTSPVPAASPRSDSTALELPEAAYVPKLRDQVAINSAFDAKPPVTLKGSAQARYIGNAAAATEVRSSARPVIASPSKTAAPVAPRFVPNGQTSGIIPGMELGTVDYSSRGVKK